MSFTSKVQVNKDLLKFDYSGSKNILLLNYPLQQKASSFAAFLFLRFGIMAKSGAEIKFFRLSILRNDARGALLGAAHPAQSEKTE